MTWPMCGAPTGQECPTCAEAGRICYHDERDLVTTRATECNAAWLPRHPGDDTLFCVLTSDHGGKHQAFGGLRWADDT